MILPNWFDKKYSDSVLRDTASELLLAIAKDPRLIKAVEDALASHDLQVAAKKIGPSRTQVVRCAIADVLQA